MAIDLKWLLYVLDSRTCNMMMVAFSASNVWNMKRRGDGRKVLGFSSLWIEKLFETIAIYYFEVAFKASFWQLRRVKRERERAKK